jgi:hypothetical protein
VQALGHDTENAPQVLGAPFWTQERLRRMGFFSMVFGDPLKSTADWGAMLFERVTKNDWDFAREHKKEVFLRMVQLRPGTPDSVSLDIREGYVDSLSQLCWNILVSEGYTDKYKVEGFAEVAEKREQIAQILMSKGIPEDLAKYIRE